MSKTNDTIQIGSFIVQLNSVLGTGATSIVYRGYHAVTFQPVAVKAIEMSKVNNEVTNYLLSAEKSAMLTIKNPYVIKTLDIIQQKDYCYLIMELCSKGTLKDYIKSKNVDQNSSPPRGKLSCSEAIQLFYKIVLGYIAIVQANFIHRDLKTSNILIRGDGNPVISDFGYCQMIIGIRPTIKYNVGSPSYMSPQAHQNSRYSQKSDIWSLGVILHEMVKGKTLDEGKDMKVFFQKVKSMGEVRIEEQGLSNLCIQLLKNSLKINYDQRVTAYKLKYLIDLRIRPTDHNNFPKSQTNFGRPTELNAISTNKFISKKEIQNLDSSYQTEKENGLLQKFNQYNSPRINYYNLNQNSFNSVQGQFINSAPLSMIQNKSSGPIFMTEKFLQRNSSQQIISSTLIKRNITSTQKLIRQTGQNSKQIHSIRYISNQIFK